MRTITDTQQDLVTASATRPIFIVEIAHSGTPEFLSASGDLTFNGQPYSAGGCRVTALEDAQAATVELPWTAQRVLEVQTGAWRNGVCKVWAIPASPDDDPAVYSLSDGILMLDGKLRGSAFQGERIVCQAAHVSAVSKISPRHTFESVCNHIPATGSQIVWEGDILTLESRR